MSAALTTFVVLLSSTRGQIPVLSITPNPVEIGLNYTLVCQVEINHAIKFFFENNEEGGCDPPFFGGSCSDTGILQDSTAKVTTWPRTANIGKEGNWTCRRETIDSDSLTLDMYECPDTVLSQSGINSNLVLNGSSKVDITARIACIYPTTNLDFQLQLIPSSGNTLSTNMTCIMTASSCTVGSAYDCNYQISDDIAFVPEIEYTVHVKAAPLSQPCDSLALFHPHTLTFESTGLTNSTYLNPTSDVSQSTERVSTNGGVTSINTVMNFPDHTVTFSSKYHSVAEKTTFSSDTADSSAILQNHTSNTYIIFSPSTILTNISIGGSYDIKYSSSLAVFSEYYNENALKSSFIEHSSFSKSLRYNFPTYSTGIRLFSYSSTIHVDGLTSVNFSFPSKTYSIDNTGLLSGDMSIFMTDENKVSLHNLSSSSFPESLARKFQSPIPTLENGTPIPERRTLSYIENSPQTIFPYTDNIQFSITSFPSALHSLSSSLEVALIIHTSSYNLSQSELTIATVPSVQTSVDNGSRISSIDENLHAYGSYSSTDLEISHFSKLSMKFDFSSVKTMSDGEKFDKISSTSFEYSIKTLSTYISTYIDNSSTVFQQSLISSLDNPYEPLMMSSRNSFLDEFSDKTSASGENSLWTLSIIASETFGVNISTSVEAFVEKTNTVLESSINEMHINTPLDKSSDDALLSSAAKLDRLSKAISIDTVTLSDSFSTAISIEIDMDKVISTPIQKFESNGISSKVQYRQTIIMSSFYSNAFESTTIVSEENIPTTYKSNSGAYLSSILSMHKYTHSSDFEMMSSSISEIASADDVAVASNNPSLSKTAKVVAISVSVTGCVSFVAITVIILFAFKLLKCEPKQKNKTNKTRINTDSHSISKGSRWYSFFDKPHGIPAKYYNNTASSWGSYSAQYTCNYNQNWDDIT